MDSDLTRRALVGAILAGGAAGSVFTPVKGYLERFAPLSGSAWEATENSEHTVDSPYGSATVRYDDYGVPNITGENEKALFFAVGYAQSRDRGFQMDLQRRQMRGQLSAVVGSQTLDSDEFHVKMDFAGAAKASADLLEDTRVGALTDAYADGVNAVFENDPSALEFALLEYEPGPWTPTDTLLLQKQIGWNLTGSFRTLRTALVADRLGPEAATELYPARLDFDSPVIRDRNVESNAPDSSEPAPHAIDPELVDWMSRFEPPPANGSNNWVVSGEHTRSGAPIVANDPHLSLMAPPVWYEMNLRTDDLSARGVTFPGVPFVVIGENDAGAWGFTNTGADVIDFYRYDSRDGKYRYKREWREFDTEKHEIEVADGENKTVTVKKTVHGPVIERENARVGVSWTGHTATRTAEAVYRYNRSEGIDDIEDATKKFDVPTQNLVYADRDGNTLYYVTGKIPIRTVDGKEVAGNRIFDGSAGEAEWQGFTPFGTSTWEGFVPFDEKPHVRNPEYIASANQRIVNDPEHYLAEAYSDPYRGIRLYDLLDRRARSDELMDPEFMKRMQDDTLDLRGEALAPQLVKAARAANDTDDLSKYIDALADWDHRMDRDSLAALIFVRWFEHYRELTFTPEFEKHGLDESYYPRDWVLQHLSSDSRWFGEDSQATVMVRALRQAISEIEDTGWETYGEYNTTDAIDHPLGLDFLSYPAYPTDGSRATVNNYGVEDSHGSSWRMITPMDGESVGVIPGGNSGIYFSEHYDDQLRMWADTEYKSMTREIRGTPTITFEREGSK